LLLAGAATGAGAEEAVRRVIAEQIAAFRRDDAAAAFSFASPTIREKFGDAATFLDMVRTAYQPVYRPGTVEFGAFGPVEGRLVQRVHLTGPDGKTVLALYIMQKQPDGSWKIDGCVLTQSDDEST
jgi:ketosteroid isomerase-like protein